ncbi:Fungal transcriptional regulatory protein N-terminal [Pyrenophora tritici-repentis]|nr:Fungal transcriptional regulatory protein N-terminal [Pyrenophora tritici-repentis]KAI1674426.1 N-terminal [Pyrenophora tritici-repentis]
MDRSKTRRACDRCHAVKEKCRRIPSQDSCERCHRLQKPCQTLRPVGTAGRKPRYPRTEDTTTRRGRWIRSEASPCASSPAYSAGEITPAPSPHTPRVELVSLVRSPSILAGLSEREMHLITCISQGRPRIEQFLIAPSFRLAHHKAVARHLYDASPWIQDALIATAALLTSEYSPEPYPEDQLIGHRRAASAVSTLRSVTKMSPGDLPIILVVAISAITFALHITGSAFTITQHSLSIIKPVYHQSLELDSDSHAFVICLIHEDADECMLRAELPTLRFLVQRPEGFVDRYLGISSPLLVHMHDICVVSHALCHEENPNLGDIARALDKIERAVDEWTPTLPDGYATRFLQEEVVSLLGQAKVYRWSLLLIIHRLRHPYGTETAKGSLLADAIIDELRLTLEYTQRTVPFVRANFMVACFELDSRAKRQVVMDMVEDAIEFSSEYRARVRQQLTAFWSMRDCEDKIHWCDIIPRLPQ